VKAHPECGACLVHWVVDRAAPHTAEKDMARLVSSVVGILLKDVTPSANLGSLCNSTVYTASELTPAMTRYYEELKATTNEHAKGFLPEAATHILDQATAREGFERACLLAAAANVSSLGAPSGAYTFSELRAVMSEGTSSTLMIGDVLDAVKTARHILYVTDNAGEIGFDALVLAHLKAMGKRVTLVVKTNTFFEDATPSDAHFFGLDRLVDEIVTTRGFAAPAELEPPVAQALADADLIMAKGTGSYEALRGELVGKPAIYMLKIKCEPIARELSTAQGNTLVLLEQPKRARRRKTARKGRV
jgi:damage-control phosphatase, subfamily I